METIQVILGADLLKAADAAAKKHKINRSALIRQAIEGHLTRLREKELEERDRRGYQSKPQIKNETQLWEEAAAWPES